LIFFSSAKIQNISDKTTHSNKSYFIDIKIVNKTRHKIGPKVEERHWLFFVTRHKRIHNHTMRGIVHPFRITQVEREAVCGDGGVEGRIGHREPHRLVSGRVDNLVASARHAGAVILLLAIGEQNHCNTNQHKSIDFFDIIHN
jgi:hypothetical protein